MILHLCPRKFFESVAGLSLYSILSWPIYFNSKIQYGIELYGSANQSLIHKLQVKQNRAIKTLFNLDYLTPTKQLHKDYKILMVSDKYKLSLSKFTYKQQNNLLPEGFEKYFSIIKDNHEHMTRRLTNLKTCKCKTDLGKKSTKYQRATLWNETPTIIRNLGKLKAFSIETKKFLINQY